ncbi:helix-turn-helix domain-containing protein [Streptomyces sp. NPDC057909]|uniref:helix-turn-helix domain-containing protein n=1 Tax=Streptomyces sp. NPDC057909 TaxID=3346277 RepID=UPI0036E40A90
MSEVRSLRGDATNRTARKQSLRMAPAPNPVAADRDGLKRKSLRRRAHLKGAARRLFAAELRSSYETGATIFELSREHKRAVSTIHELLREAGTIFRPRGVRPQRHQFPE